MDVKRRFRSTMWRFFQKIDFVTSLVFTLKRPILRLFALLLFHAKRGEKIREMMSKYEKNLPPGSLQPRLFESGVCHPYATDITVAAHEMVGAAMKQALYHLKIWDTHP